MAALPYPPGVRQCCKAAEAAASTISAAPAEHYPDDSQMRAYLSLTGVFGKCDLTIGDMAIQSLNTARKLYWRGQQSSLVASAELALYTDTSYAHAIALWRYFYDSCQWTGLSDMDKYRDQREALLVFGRVNKEYSEFVAVP